MMPKFQVLIEGQGIPGQLFDEPQKRFGFFATRWVEAADAGCAELVAVERLREEYGDWLKKAMKGPSPTMHLSEITEVSSFPPDYSNRGIT